MMAMTTSSSTNVNARRARVPNMAAPPFAQIRPQAAPADSACIVRRGPAKVNQERLRARTLTRERRERLLRSGRALGFLRRAGARRRVDYRDHVGLQFLLPARRNGRLVKLAAENVQELA